MAAICKWDLQKARIVFSSLDVVHVRGKRGRQIPVLINTDKIHGIEALIKYCSDYVNSNNVYVFAVQNNESEAYLRGNDSMHKILDQVPNLEAPERVKSAELQVLCYSFTNSRSYRKWYPMVGWPYGPQLGCSQKLLSFERQYSRVVQGS